MESRTHKELLKIGLVELGVIKLWVLVWFKLWFQSFYYKKEWCSLLFKGFAAYLSFDSLDAWDSHIRWQMCMQLE